MGLLCSTCSLWFQAVSITEYARLFDLPDEPWVCLTCALLCQTPFLTLHCLVLVVIAMLIFLRRHYAY